MKKLLLFLLACNAFFCQAQFAEKRNDTALDKHIKKVILSDNQFFSTDKKDYIVLFNIVPGTSLENKDSLLKESKEIYRRIIAKLGKRWENETIDIAYWGKETDKNNYGFSYSRDLYKGEVTYSYRPDTLLAPDNNVGQRLAGLADNRYVRHELDKDGLSIVFNVILKDASIMNQKLAEIDALKFWILYIRRQYCLYNSMKIIYIDQYSGDRSQFTIKIDELIVNNLVDYYNSKRHAASQP